MAGLFITLEGIDGAGKSSHVPFLIDYFTQLGREVVSTREPGGTPLGEALREIVLNQPMHPETEALLVFASRREHVAAVIAPALARGAVVISDRFTDATYAYQCGGRGLDTARIGVLETWVHEHLQPDLTFLFDAPTEVARDRLDKNTVNQDKFERERGEFFNRVRATYLARAQQFPQRFDVIDSSRSLVQIRDELMHRLQQHTARRSLKLGHLQ
jgi:dTMP kinase